MGRVDVMHREEARMVTGKMVTGFGCAWVAFALLGLAMLGGVAYVAAHFLAKVW